MLDMTVAEAPHRVKLPVAPDADPDECRSGGAAGSDSLWGDTAAKLGHQVTHYIFPGYRAKATTGDFVTLSEDQLELADAHCHAANVLLQRRYPPDNRYIQNLLRRNWYQVEGSKSLYAISSFKRQKVVGGTAWAVAMFLIKHDLQTCPAYVFDQEARHWFTWRGAWEEIYEPPFPQGVYAGIGTRNLNLNGRLAVKTVFED